MQLVVASRNQKKIAELRTMLAALCPAVTLLSLDDIHFTEDTPETGTTFIENALIKANAITTKGYIAVADDSGLCVDALNGAPGIFSARYANDHGNDAANNAKLLHALESVELPARTAHYACAIACTFPHAEPIVVTGRCDGVILRQPRGNNGFGYDPLFFDPTYQKTFAELSGEEKAAVSHRGKAMRAFANALAERLAALGKESV